MQTIKQSMGLFLTHGAKEKTWRLEALWRLQETERSDGTRSLPATTHPRLYARIARKTHLFIN